MNKCLVTRLQSSVNAEGLKKLGVFEIDIPSLLSSQTLLQFQVNADTVVKDLTNVFPDGTSERVMADSAGGIYLTAGSHKLEFSPKYNIDVISTSGMPASISIDLEDVAYLTNLERLTLEETASKGDLASLKNLTKLTVLTLSSCLGIYGDISSLTELLNLKTVTLPIGVTGNISVFSDMSNLRILQANGSRLSGLIQSIGNLTSLENLVMSSCLSVTGSVEEFVAAQRAAGRTTYDAGTSFNFGYSGITFNGERMMSDNTAISWTASTITVNGATITA